MRGRILDIGCGAGRHCLYLQGKGFDVTGIDNSPLSIEVCRQRGLQNAAVLPLGEISPALGVFDTVLMFGSNFGLFGSFKGARRILKKLDRITSGQARIIAMTTDVYRTEDPDQLNYHEYNRIHGRMSGQLKIKGKVVSENVLFFEKFKWIDFPDPKLKARVVPQPGPHKIFSVEVSAERFAKSVYLEFPGIEACLSDNYFDMFPRTKKTITVCTGRSVRRRELKKKLTLGSLWQLSRKRI